jgi:DNA-binding CsgD family transcriptional regulator
VTRVVIVASSEKLRAELAAALRAGDAFDVVGAVASEQEVSETTDVVLVAHASDDHGLVTARHRADTIVGPVLTNREREILGYLAEGLGNKQIAARLGISANTVKTHLELLFEKLSVSSRAEAVAAGVRRGLLLL